MKRIRQKPVRFRLYLAFLFAALACAGLAWGGEGAGTSGPGDAAVRGPLVLRNDALRVEIDLASGNIASLENLATGQTLLRASPGDLRQAPWAAEFLSGAKESDRGAAILSFRHESESASSARLLWKAEGGLEVEGRVELAPGNGGLELRLAARTGPEQTLASVEYPILRGLQAFTRPEDSYLAIPYKEGHLFRDPLGVLDAEGPARPNLFAFNYPRGHSLTMQFAALYEQGKGGAGFATHDPHGTVKSFALSVQNGSRVFSVRQWNWDCRPGAEYNPDYPFVVEPLREGSWQEAARLYKRWAAGQRWAQRPLSQRRERLDWLFGQTGFSVFGISASEDQRPWYDAFHEIARPGGAEVLFIAAAGAWNVSPAQALAGEPFPANPVALKNIETVHRNGDAILPFSFDLRMNPRMPGWSDAASGVPGSPWAPRAIQSVDLPGQESEALDAEVGGKGVVNMCPTQAPFLEYHTARDALLAQTYQFDGSYYDISVNLAPTACFAAGHGHPLGWGRWIFDAYHGLADHSRQAEEAKRGRPVAMGTEQMTELMMDAYDFYHMGGSGLGPVRRPGSRFDRLILSGQCRQIPLFDFVYHEFGPVRTGGKTQISTDVGDAWYYIAGQEYLWGALLELIYCNTPLELFPGTQAPTLKTGFQLASRQWEPNPRTADPAKIAFLKECAALRAGPGKEFLAYGTMLAPPQPRQSIGLIRLPYWHYSDIQGPKFSRKVDFPCPELLCEAWRAADGRSALFLLNLRETPLTAEFDSAALARCAGAPVVSLEPRFPSDFDAKALSETPGLCRIQLPPRRTVMLEAAGGASAAEVKTP
ncbi:MAG: DUF6259 domain-containing protein [Candidatus Sumerlaeota bacterium]|nr:DUF6259 domain-containing protein [Candidatus Sumerlaeota bacterium]